MLIIETRGRYCKVRHDKISNTGNLDCDMVVLYCIVLCWDVSCRVSTLPHEDPWDEMPWNAALVGQNCTWVNREECKKGVVSSSCCNPAIMTLIIVEWMYSGGIKISDDGNSIESLLWSEYVILQENHEIKTWVKKPLAEDPITRKAVLNTAVIAVKFSWLSWCDNRKKETNKRMNYAEGKRENVESRLDGWMDGWMEKRSLLWRVKSISLTFRIWSSFFISEGHSKHPDISCIQEALPNHWSLTFFLFLFLSSSLLTSPHLFLFFLTSCVLSSSSFFL